MLARLAGSQECHYVVFQLSMNFTLFQVTLHSKSSHNHSFFILVTFDSPPGFPFGIDKTLLSAFASPALAITIILLYLSKNTFLSSLYLILFA